MQHIALGEAIIRPKQPLVAGSFTTITFTYTAGHPIDDSGYVKVVFRSLGDFGTPQFDDPTTPDYCTVHTTGDCRVEPRWDPKGHTRPWSRALFLKVRGGFLLRMERQYAPGRRSQRLLYLRGRADLSQLHRLAARQTLCL